MRDQMHVNDSSTRGAAIVVFLVQTIWDSSNTKRFPCLCATTRDAWRPDTVEIAEAVYDFDIACASWTSQHRKLYALTYY